MNPEDDVNAWCAVDECPAIVCGGPHEIIEVTLNGFQIIGKHGETAEEVINALREEGQRDGNTDAGSPEPDQHDGMDGLPSSEAGR